MVGFRVFDVGLLIVWLICFACATTTTTLAAMMAEGARVPIRARPRTAPGAMGSGCRSDATASVAAAIAPMAALRPPAAGAARSRR